jgi:predicted amidohydrolase YtcJ
VIFVGGRIYAPDHPGATAVVTDGGLISYVGSDEEARRSAPRQAEVDLRGRLLTPAFVDAHVHLIQTGQVERGRNRCLRPEPSLTERLGVSRST